MSLPNDEDHVAAIRDALDASRRPLIWPSAMPLPDAVRELKRWLMDDRQWRHASPGNWKSLVADVARAVGQYPDTVLKQAGDSNEIADELDQLTTASGNKDIRAEGALRLRLDALARALTEGLTTAAARRAAWIDLRHRASSPQAAEMAARRLLSLCAWAGHDAARLRDGLLSDLDRPRIGPLAPPHHRLMRAGERVVPDAPRASVVVWMRLIFAPIEGEPVVDLGPRVRLYEGNRFREMLEADNHPEAPPEVASDSEGRLRLLSHRRVLTREGSDDAIDPVDAFIRVELEDVFVADALPLARGTAAMLGGIGTLYGAEPSLWLVDPSHVTFRDGRYGSASYVAPPMEVPSITELTGIGRDPTIRVLRENRERLAPHLPIGHGPLASVAELLRWMRDARSSPPPARLVLYDRAIEAVSAWAGIASPRRFVEQDLVPSWARGQIDSELLRVANAVVEDDRQYYPSGTPQRRAWDLLLVALGIDRKPNGNFAVDLPRLVSRLQWLQQQETSVPGEHLRELTRHLSSGKAADTWLESLTKAGLANEARRFRTRNALMHGGPLADATIELVVPFAQFMANQAVGRTLEAHLANQQVMQSFVNRAAELRAMRRRLKLGESPTTALFTPFKSHPDT